MYVLIRVFVFYLLSGQPELFTDLDFHSLEVWNHWRLSAYLVIYISVLLFCCQLCISGLLCIWDFMSYLLSNRYYVFCIWFWYFVIVASWTTMVFYFPLRDILMFCVCDLILFAPNFHYNLLFCTIQVRHVWIIDLNGGK